MQNDEPDVLGELERQFGTAEIWEIVRCYRIHGKRPDGDPQTVVVEVKRHRVLGWSIVATDPERNLTATGNHDKNLGAAMMLVHWSELDR